MRKLQVLRDYSEAMQEMVAAIKNNKNVFQVIDTIDKAISVIEELVEIMRDDADAQDGAYEQMRNELEGFIEVRAQLISTL